MKTTIKTLPFNWQIQEILISEFHSMIRQTNPDWKRIDYVMKRIWQAS
jgi:hypothetical protein